MKIAIVHDFLIEYGGAERVLEVMHEIWPEAPVYCAFYDLKRLGPHAERFKNWDIRPSWVQNSWFIKRLHSPLRFLTPLVWKYFDFSEFDVVLISSGWYMPRGVALSRTNKPSFWGGSRLGGRRLQNPTSILDAVPTKSGPCQNDKNIKKPVFVCYLHTVPRYLYGYATKMNWQKYWPIRVYGNIINHFLRIYDFRASQGVDYFITNSQETKRRVWKFYRRESIVIYPPAEINKSRHSERSEESRSLSRDPSVASSFRMTGNYFLCVSRLAAPKRIDLAIKACSKLKLPLVVVGKGPEEKYLKSIAGPTIKFLGEVPDEELSEIYKNCQALIFPAIEEDFGIVPVEAMGYGKPVIALRSGGVVETVIDGKTGLFFNEPQVKSLIETIKRFEKMKNQLSQEACFNQAKKFSKEIFKEKIRDFVTDKA